MTSFITVGSLYVSRENQTLINNSTSIVTVNMQLSESCIKNVLIDLEVLKTVLVMMRP